MTTVDVSPGEFLQYHFGRSMEAGNALPDIAMLILDIAMEQEGLDKFSSFRTNEGDDIPLVDLALLRAYCQGVVDGSRGIIAPVPGLHQHGQQLGHARPGAPTGGEGEPAVTAPTQKENNMVDIRINYKAYLSVLNTLPDSTHETALTKAAVVAWEGAIEGGRHPHIFYTVSASREQWNVLWDELNYRYEINGGGHDPYCVEEDYMLAYIGERLAVREAMDIVRATLDDYDDSVARVCIVEIKE